MKHTLITCTARCAFTEFVVDYGQVHGDPNNPDATDIPVPESVVAKLVDERKIKDPAKSGPEPLAVGDFTLTYKPVGFYTITGPGLDEPETVRGKVAAEARAAELYAALADSMTVGEDDAADDDNDGAPVE